ncbi:MAG: hypothetical protein KAJ10_16785, partial [Thermodesulfovibrionia bacterium]|nr:hypothetical protein [Thermodesulfovibrionia bacterium]
KQKYDIIVSEPSNPWVSGTAGLFSEEFYKMASRQLKQDGIFCQWLQLYEIDLELIGSILKALSSGFSDYAVYAASTKDLVIVATNNNSIPHPDAALFNYPELSKALKRVRVSNIQDIVLRKVGDRKVLDPFFATFPIRGNSDYYPVLDQNAVRTRFLQKNAKALVDFSHKPLPAIEILTESNITWEHTEVTPSHHIPQAAIALSAMALRDFLLQGYSNGEIQPDAIAKASALMRFASGDCSQTQGLIANLYDVVALRMAPYLRPAELEGVWSVLEAGQCFQTLTPRDNAWIKLFKAVGQRDVEEMKVTAEYLLANERDLPPAPKKYIAAAGMIAHIKEGNPDKSLRIWNEHLSSMYEEHQPEMLFRILVANSGL